VRALACGLGLSLGALSACKGDDVDLSAGERAVGDFFPLAGASWTWRDDGSDDEPDQETLLHARATGGGEVGIRRGSRWADGADVGTLTFDLSTGLTLASWDLPDASGAGNRRLAPAIVQTGSNVVTGARSCQSALGVEVETFYAVFDRTLVVTCDGAQFPAGTWVFAEGVGLVAMDADALPIELVAPW
jgi:hypothetical protein